MISKTQPKVVPVVDLSDENLKPGTDAWLLACKQVQHALEEYSCFEAVYNKATLEIHNSIFSAIKDLCDLPLETKMQKASNRPFHNYFGQLPLNPRYETLGIQDPASLEGAQRFTNIMWPAGNDRFRESVHSFSKVVVELDQMVKRMVFDAYGVGRLYDSYKASTTYQLRCINYKSQLTNETTDLGLIPHTDKNFTSILHQNDVGGLQIKTKDGEWIEAAPSSPSSFLVLASDLFMAWSNDRISACEHQVVLKEKKARYSLALFSYIGDGVVQVPEEFVDGKHPLKYKPFGHFDYLRFYETDEEARKSKNPIKAYCGV